MPFIIVLVYGSYSSGYSCKLQLQFGKEARYCRYYYYCSLRAVAPGPTASPSQATRGSCWDAGARVLAPSPHNTMNVLVHFLYETARPTLCQAAYLFARRAPREVLGPEADLEARELFPLCPQQTPQWPLRVALVQTPDDSQP